MQSKLLGAPAASQDDGDGRLIRRVFLVSTPPIPTAS